MSRPLAVDLFCGAGGASMGLHRAGFEVVGVDIRPQPRYPFRFIRGDALRPPVDLSRFALIWASPPCQRFSAGLQKWGEQRRLQHPDHIPAIRMLLDASGCLSVIENVVGAPIRADVVLTGGFFGLPIARRRHFEVSGFPPPLSLHVDWASRTTANGGLACVAGHGPNRGRFTGRWRDMPESLRRALSQRNSVAGWREAMGIDWMRRHELSQAVPPAYAEFIGRAALALLDRRPA